MKIVNICSTLVKQLTTFATTSSFGTNLVDHPIHEIFEGAAFFSSATATASMADEASAGERRVNMRQAMPKYAMRD